MGKKRGKSRYLLQERGDSVHLLLPRSLDSASLFALLYATPMGAGIIGLVVIFISLSPGGIGSGYAVEASQLILNVGVAVLLLCLVGCSWVWLFAVLGRQAVDVSAAGVRVERVLSLGSWTWNARWAARSYALEQVQKLRVFPAVGFFAQGPFAFDYRGRPVWFGGGLKEAEVREIWREFQKRFPLLTAEG